MIFQYMRTLVIFLILFISNSSLCETFIESSDQVWKVGQRRWSIEEEVRYGKWVEENITEDFFIRYNVPVDCADVPYAVRWIYSRISHLPAAATTKDGKLIGHWSTNFKHLPTHLEWQRDRRFHSALLQMLTETTTRTLPYDTYPIKINPDSVTPGTIFFVTESHSGIIGRIVIDGSSAHPLQTWEASYPIKLQKLIERDFLTPRPESTIYSGLVKFRWPIFENGNWKYLSPKEYPFYSLEQYSGSFLEGSSDFVDAVAKRIDPNSYDPWEKMEKVLKTTHRYLMDRVPIVLEGYKRCYKGGCPEGSISWEIYSTPGRDGRIILLMDHLYQIIETNKLNKDEVKKRMEEISIPIKQGASVTFYHVFNNYHWLSSNPRDSIEARWGLKKCEMISSRIKTTKKSIHFIEKTYRKRDPKYADFAIRQQQHILQRLYEEWEKSHCKESP